MKLWPLWLICPSLVLADMGQQTVNPRVYSRNTCMPAAYPLHCARETVTEYFITPPTSTQHFPALPKTLMYISSAESVHQHYAVPDNKVFYFPAASEKMEYRTSTSPQHVHRPAAQTVAYYRAAPVTKHHYVRASNVQRQYYAKAPMVGHYLATSETAVSHYSNSPSIIRHHYAEPQTVYLNKPDRQRKYELYAPNGYRVRYRLPPNMVWRHCVPESTKMLPYAK